jgi:hypothetical protein
VDVTDLKFRGASVYTERALLAQAVQLSYLESGEAPAHSKRRSNLESLAASATRAATPPACRSSRPILLASDSRLLHRLVALPESPSANVKGKPLVIAGWLRGTKIRSAA